MTLFFEMKLMQLVFMLSQFDANSYTYLCARVKDRTYVTLVLRSVTGQLCYRSYRYPYTLVLLK